MIRWRRLMASILAASLLVVPTAIAAPAEKGREIHGASDAFAAEGVAIAWAVLRAANGNADDATVVIRIARDEARFPAIGIVAVDPFSGQSQSIRAPAPARGTLDVATPRRRFADTPRTDVNLYASAAAAPAPAATDRPALTIFYLGVPDTAPEFDTLMKLRAWLDDRLARLRSSPGGKSP